MLVKLVCITALIFISSCDEPYRLRKARGNYGNKVPRMASGYSYKKKPSEAAGFDSPIENKIHTQSDYYAKRDAAEKKQEFVEVIDEDNDYVGHFKVGNEYQVEGISYVPQNYEDFEETGVASWYGDDFHGKLTANGETYNMETLTAAHPTLPLPSMVKVTNLRNSKSVVVRVNDRGPFAKERIIDVSERAAEMLGFKDKGTTEVKVELLRSETEELLKKLKLKNSGI